MRQIDRIYIDGEFVEPHGRERVDLHNPATGAVIGQVRLGDEEDARRAIAAAKRALPVLATVTKAERVELLKSLQAAMRTGAEDLTAAIIEEYGAPASRAAWMARFAAESIGVAAATLEAYDFRQRIGSAEVFMEPVGVVGLITPWNSNAGFICNKLAYALAAGCTAVIKPSEMSAIQTEIVLKRLHAAGLPRGFYNVVNGRGDVVGAELTRHPDIAKISFTGSTAVGKTILRGAAETIKRVTLELGGKSPVLVLDDVDLAATVPLLLEAGFMNSGQACIAGTRILISEKRRAELETLITVAVAQVKVGDPRDPATAIGPMVSRKQYERVQGYIRKGIDEGARLLVGGEGHPDGLGGFFVRPTVFSDVRNDMTIAREEIFGPVLSILTYRDEEEAIAIANDTSYGLSAYVLSSDQAHAEHIASRLQSGRVVINGAAHEPLAPFGGFKQSGLGRENGVFGLETYLEPKTVLGSRAVA
ncbi:MAG TPA: aldehyde dehydrogenase family protein [Dongiaceae bacterium]|nr:aldehyde dehydrogenase family protein [Dongiaceae bacterium]